MSAPEIIIDNFAGGGGASTGIQLALGRDVDVAINHDAEALAMHGANHPGARHLREDVFSVDIRAVTAGRPVGLGWFSPDCKHFSKAKGGKPRSKNIRALAWVMAKWAVVARPRVMVLENVEEFQTWGPLLADGSPCARRKGATFRRFLSLLRRLGYVVDHRELRACDYGAPTIRKRLFLIARCDGQPIVWPEATHGAPDSEGVKSGRLRPWRTAAECIDFSLPCPSIFDRKRPLAEATLRRIARGLRKFVIEAAEPFVINVANSKTTGRGPNAWSADEPLRTITASPGFAVVAPVLTEHANATSPRSWAANEPLRTQCAQVKGGHFALIAPTLVETAHAEVSPKGVKRWGQGAQPTTKPLNTVAAGGGNAALVSAFLAKHYGGHETPGTPLDKPASTVTAVDHHGLVTAHMTKFRSGSTGSALDEPLHTATAGGDPARPSTGNVHGLVTAHVAKLRGDNVGHGMDEPAHTVSAQGTHLAEVRAFFVKYYGNEKDGVSLRDPMHTVTAKDRLGLVTIHGTEYVITDIGLRMLSPRELFRAQGFPEGYVIGDGAGGELKLTKSAQVRMCGNSVCPPMAEAIVRANCPELVVRKERAA